MIDSWLRSAAPHTGAGPAVLALAAVVPLSWWWVRRTGRSEVEAALGAAAAIAVVVALTVTLLRYGRSPTDLGQLRTCHLTDPGLFTTEGLLNLLLLAPAAFLGVLAVGRPLAVTAVLTGVSVGIETVQAVTAVGVCDSSDVVHNAAGAAAAAALAALVRGGVRAAARAA